jgi:cytochrome c556
LAFQRRKGEGQRYEYKGLQGTIGRQTLWSGLTLSSWTNLCDSWRFVKRLQAFWVGIFTLIMMPEYTNVAIKRTTDMGNDREDEKGKRRPSRTLAARAIFEQNISTNAERGFDSNILGSSAKARPIVSGSSVQSSIQSSVKVSPRRSSLPVQNVEQYASKSPLRRQTVASTAPDLNLKTKPEQSVMEDEESLPVTEAETEQTTAFKASQGSSTPESDFAAEGHNDAERDTEEAPAAKKPQNASSSKSEAKSESESTLIHINEISNDAKPEKPEDQDRAARKIQRVSRHFSNNNNVRRQEQLNMFQELQRKREHEVSRLEKIKKGRKIKSIRNSVAIFEQTIEKNKEYGFDSTPLPNQFKRRISRAIPKAVDIQSFEIEDDTAAASVEKILDAEPRSSDEGEHSIGPGQAFAQETPPARQCAATNSIAKSFQKGDLNNSQSSDDSPFLTSLPMREGVVSYNTSYSSMISVDPPIPKVIEIGPKAAPDSSLHSRWSSQPAGKKVMSGSAHENVESSRWLSEPVSPKKKTRWDNAEPQRIIYHRPPPSTLKQPEDGSRWAVYPTHVYGPPSRKPSESRWDAQEQPKKFSGDSRWAASTRHKKKKIFPSNPSRSRWAAQVTSPRVVKRTTTPRASITDSPTKQIKRRASLGSITLEQESQPSELILSKTKENGKVEDLHDSLSFSTSMPMVDRSSQENNLGDLNQSGHGGGGRRERNGERRADLSLSTKSSKLLNRKPSLGEVKQMRSAIRIQSFMRTYLQRYKYKMARGNKKKDDLMNDTAEEIQHIRDCLELRKTSIRERMELDRGMGLPNPVDSIPAPPFASDGEDVVAESASLRQQISELEEANAELQKQINRLRTSNGRMEAGSRSRKQAVKEVSSRLEKLKDIQTKLNKVYKEFQADYANKKAKLEQTDCYLKREKMMEARTKKCIRKILNHIREKVKDIHPDLMEELEESVPLDCLM